MAGAAGSATAKVVGKAASKEWLNYFASTHFWGPVFNWSIPLAAMADIQKNPELISGKMTTAMMLYSGLFMRFALKVQPRNLLLFACHITNFSTQGCQGLRFLDYNYRQDENARAQTKIYYENLEKEKLAAHAASKAPAPSSANPSK